MMGGRSGSIPQVTATAGSGGIRRPRAPAAICGSDDDTRLLLRGILLLYRHPVTREAKSPSELGRLPPESRFIVYDITGDGSGAAETLAGLIREHPGIPVLALLPAGGEGLRADVERAGAQGTLGKPFVSNELIRAIEALLADAASG
jgi:DNA-binding NarL/FixJ family response regulator